ncbi:MAG: hypothetical protein BYD32DRAFT_414338 [Podila humilis]|nr:MAG: hypothetical protein BYD32DRAFT_414338 [Podila humilis]
MTIGQQLLAGKHLLKFMMSRSTVSLLLALDFATTTYNLLTVWFPDDPEGKICLDPGPLTPTCVRHDLEYTRQPSCTK